MTKNQTIELHNKVTELHKLTNAATTGTVALDWERVLDVNISMLTLLKNHCKMLKAGTPIDDSFKETTKEEPKKLAPTELSK